MGFDNIDIKGTFDSFVEGTKETAEFAHQKTSEFHENYISKVTPDLGKYGDAARFVAEMAPGVSEYNAIREGDWQGFAISAGIDIAAVAAGAFSFGSGYAAVKGTSTVAKAGVKVATKEIAEAGAKKVAKEVAEAGAKKVVKEVAEAGAEKAVKEVVEAGAEKAVKEVVEAGTEKAVKEAAEKGAKVVAQEAVDTGSKKVTKELAEIGAEKAAKKVAEAGTEKAVKETADAATEKVVKEVVESGAEKTAKEVTEAGTEKAVKEVVEKGAEKAVKDTAETVTEKTAKEFAEAGTEKAVRETAEKGAEKTAKEVAETATKKTAKETTEKLAKEATEKGAEKAVKEAAEAGGEKTVKEVAEEVSETTTKEVKENIDQVADKHLVVTDVGKELRPDQIKNLTDKGMSPGIVNDCTIKDDVIYLKTRNEKFVDNIQPESGVTYVEKTIDLFGTKVEGVFPKFDAAYTTKLPTDKLMVSDKIQFDHCMDQLKRDISKNPSLKEKFTPRQLEQIMNGKTPGGYTWHHNEEVGKMELVETAIHDMAKHTGGKAIWGGGRNFR